LDAQACSTEVTSVKVVYVASSGLTVYAACFLGAVLAATNEWRMARELARLERLPRCKPAHARVLGLELAIVDGASFA
jgi:hypothetical protein